MYEFQLSHKVPLDSLYQDLVHILRSFRNIDDEVDTLNVVIVELFSSYYTWLNQLLVPIQVVAFLLLNMFLNVSWCLHSISSSGTVSEESLSSLLGKRDALLEELQHFLNNPFKLHGDGRCKTQLAYRVSTLIIMILAHINLDIFVLLLSLLLDELLFFYKYLA